MEVDNESISDSSASSSVPDVGVDEASEPERLVKKRSASKLDSSSSDQPVARLT